MEELFTRVWEDLLARGGGPLHLRLILQPLMATVLAIRAGWADAREGRPILLWTLLFEPSKTRTALANLWKLVGTVFLVAVALDVIFQLVVFHWVYPLETLIVATLLALVPCMIVRAIGNHVVTFVRQRRLRHSKQAPVDDSGGPRANNPGT